MNATQVERRRAQHRAYYQAHRDEALARQRANDMGRREEKRAYARTRYAADRDRFQRQNRAYYAANTEARRAYHRAYHQANPSRRLAARVSRYGLTVVAYAALLEAQSGACAICRQPERTGDPATGRVRALAVDHDHRTGSVRGLLCSSCNLAIGALEERDCLRAAVEYIERAS